MEIGDAGKGRVERRGRGKRRKEQKEKGADEPAVLLPARIGL